MTYTYQDYKDRLDNIFNIYAEHNAVVCINSDDSQTKLLYSDVLGLFHNIAQVLSDAGYKRADRIAVVSPHSAYAVVLNLALAYAGYIAVLIDSSLPEHEINRLLDYSDVQAVFVTEQVFEKLEDNLISLLPVFIIGNNFTYKPYEISNVKLKRALSVPTNENVIAIIFSSGTTSSMKGVEVTYHSICQAFDFTEKYVFLYLKPTQAVKFLNVLPSNHIAGYSVATSCFMKGGEMGFIAEVNAQNLGKAFSVYQPSVFIMIPAVYNAIKNKITTEISKKSWVVRAYFKFAMSVSHWFRKTTGRTLNFLVQPIKKVALGKNMQYCGCGTAPCSDELMSFYLDLGCDFVNVYGTTETGFPVATSNCYHIYSVDHSINASEYDGTDVIIGNKDNNGIGEILIKTSLIMNGYFREPELTKQAFDENGYFKTGDSGYFDINGNIHITGRVKETILLHTGKKVSPADVDAYYAKMYPNYKIVSCGVPVDSTDYDEIHLFIEGQYTDNEIQKIKEEIFTNSSTANTTFNASGIHAIEKIPTTTIGKIKRFKLREYAQSVTSIPKSDSRHIESETDIVSIIYELIDKYKNSFSGEINEHTVLKDTLGFDSLTMFEITTEIENRLHIDISTSLSDVNTVRDLISAVRSPKIAVELINVADYPAPKTPKLLKKLQKWIKLSRKLYKFEVSGLENIPQNENYIISSNHINNLDPIWLLAAMGGNASYEKIGSLAAVHLFENKFTRNLCDMMGAIPVDRSGNTVPAMNRCRECLENGMSLIIFPEGARTVDGKLLPFKNGTAKLSIESGKAIVPTRIDGGFEVFPRHKKLPHLFNWKRMSKYVIKITFGTPIYPNGKDEIELTAELKNCIENIQ